ncbi:acyltransferase family protein [Nonomuraea recticatena]|uniref:acyltransferase family protein n=1 Tax=Nonomuraea recticatena TaxID=46178 RepID=UPI00361C8524
MTVLLERPATPVKSRDTFIDVLRIAGMALVVLQHWTIPVLAYDGVRLTTGNALSTPGVWVITWISQVMPLVFFAGGAANAISFRRAHGTAPAWLAVRLRRLAWPVLPLAAVWIPFPQVLATLGVPEQPLEVGSRLTGQLLWFLAVYVIAVTATPLMLRLHDRYGLLAPWPWPAARSSPTWSGSPLASTRSATSTSCSSGSPSTSSASSTPTAASRARGCWPWRGSARRPSWWPSAPTRAA